MTMTRWKAILLLVGTLAISAAVLGYALGRPRQAALPTPMERRPLACRLSVGDELAFDVESTTEGRKPDASAPERLRLSAEMWWRVVEDRAASGWVVAVALRDVTLERGAQDQDPVRRAALSAPFLLHV